VAGDSVVSTPDLGQTSIGTAATLALDGLRAQVDAQHSLDVWLDDAQDIALLSGAISSGFLAALIAAEIWKNRASQLNLNRVRPIRTNRDQPIRQAL